MTGYPNVGWFKLPRDHQDRGERRHERASRKEHDEDLLLRAETEASGAGDPERHDASEKAFPRA